ncbi:multiple sugar transport system permease protein [Abditibacterium utsteinense]|uniref:Multiple sugar transport system permease protein n=1 Tax=Abditibacterium utsteinense TaxID=1960156 RepID=A0A2S8SRS6_9BACT|nr:extracellular solute-binding protein [Abditibacterium utsteinense]PQV63511.1 multiple sugar transport system permease protein [Abditibacterium utsteinense]
MPIIRPVSLRLVVSSVCLIFLLLLGNSPHLSLAQTAPTSKARTKLVVWGLPSGPETAGTDAQVTEFEKRNPDIQVSRLSMGAGDMNPQKLMTAIVGGVPPDLIAQDRFTIGDWASRDTFRPLDSFIKADKGSREPVQASDFYPAAWNEAVYKDHVYAIPTGIDDRLLFYNRKMFKAAGLDPNKPPRTWDDLMVYAKKLTKLNKDGNFKQIGFIPNYGNSWLYLYSWQNGGEFLSPNGRICTLDNPQSVAALKYMADFYDMLGGYNKVNVFQSGFQSNEQDPFFTGRVAMVINGSWNMNNIARYAPDLDFGVVSAPVPKERLEGKGRFAGQDPFITWTGGYSLAVPAGSAHPNEAWRFIKWMSSEESTLINAAAQKKFSESKGRPFVFALTSSPRLNAALLKNFPPESPRLLAGQKAFIDALPTAKYRPVTFVGQTLWDAHVRAFERACQHAQTPQAALTEQRRLVQTEIDKASARQSLPLFSFAGPVSVILALALAGLTFGGVRMKRQMGGSRSAKREAVAGYLMVAPWLFGFLLLTAGPIIVSLLLAFCDYDVLHAPRFNGLSNFHTLFTDDRELLLKAFGNAFYLSIIGIPLGMATGLGIAMLLNMKVKGMKWYRTAFYIPSIVPAIASAVLWSWILAGDPNKGLLNAIWNSTLTQWFGWLPPGWFGVAEWAKPGLIVQGLWGAGGGMILWLAGLQGISPSLYEAAQIDGARGWAQFRHITLPMLSPYIFFNLIMGTIGALQEFDRVYVLAGGGGGYGPLDSLLVPVLYLFNNAFKFFKMGYASAIAWVVFLVILMLAMLQLWAQKYWVHYETDK